MDAMQAVLLDQLKSSAMPLAFVLGGAWLLGRFAKAQPRWGALALLLTPVPLLGFSLQWPALKLVATAWTPILMLLLLLDGFLLTIPVAKIQISRALNRKLSVGQASAVALTLINNSEKPITGMIMDSAPLDLLPGEAICPPLLKTKLAPFSRETLSYEILPTRRGLYRFERVHFRYRSRLGLLWIALQGGRPESVKVTPDLRRVQRMRILASRSHNAGELQKRSLGVEGTQFAGLRHYFPGDDLKKMAWAATARQDLPVVRTFSQEVEQPILVLLDAGRRMQAELAADGAESAFPRQLSRYDWALNAALAFIGVAIDRGDRVGAGVFSNQVLARVPLGTGRTHLSRLLEALGETQVQAVEPDYEAVMLSFARTLKRRALVVVFTDLIDPLASHSLLQSLKGFSCNHLLLVVTFADSATQHLARQAPDSAESVYEKGVALDLLALREQTKAALAKSGNTLVVDAPPDTLDETLIRQYLQLKQRNRL